MTPKDEELLLDVARKEHADWMRAFERERNAGREDGALSCLEGANAVQQLIKKMERALRTRTTGDDKP
jgi:hypothetical protein